MLQETTRPTYLEVSNHFFHDAVDFEVRYRHCMPSEGPLFYTPRSRRMKCFIDLRMGIESALKSVICYFANNGRKGKTLVNWIEKFGHDTSKMLRKSTQHLPDEFLQKYSSLIEALDSLPVGLRYRLDTWDFRENKEQLYYNTIGSDLWLEKLYQALVELIEFANSHLKGHSRIVSASEILKEIMEPRYKKYT